MVGRRAWESLPKAEASTIGSVTYEFSPRLPDGLKFDPDGVRFAGSPAMASSYREYTFTATFTSLESEYVKATTKSISEKIRITVFDPGAHSFLTKDGLAQTWDFYADDENTVSYNFRPDGTYRQLSPVRHGTWGASDDVLLMVIHGFDADGNLRPLLALKRYLRWDDDDQVELCGDPYEGIRCPNTDGVIRRLVRRPRT